MIVKCPYCKAEYEISAEQIGMKASCSVCKQVIVLREPGYEAPRQTRRKNPKSGLSCLLILLLLGAVGGGIYWHLKSNSDAEKKKGAAKSSESAKNAAKAAPLSKADLTSSQSNLKQIYIALNMFADDFNGAFPASVNDLPGGLLPPVIFIAPFDKISTVAAGKIGPENITYAYIGGSVRNGTPVIIAFEKPWLLPEGTNQINILLGDGTVRTETINGVSKMSCRQVVEFWTKSYSNKAQVRTLLESADKVDAARQGK